jgi:hypothetical protein
MSVLELVARFKRKQQTEQAERMRSAAEITRAAADGEAIGESDLEQWCITTGKTVDEFPAAVELVKRRKKLVEAVAAAEAEDIWAGLAAAEAQRRALRVEAEQFEAAQKQRTAEINQEATRLQLLQTTAERARRELLSTCSDSTLVESFRAAEREQQQLGLKAKELGETIESIERDRRGHESSLRLEKRELTPASVEFRQAKIGAADAQLARLRAEMELVRTAAAAAAAHTAEIRRAMSET